MGRREKSGGRAGANRGQRPGDAPARDRPRLYTREALRQVDRLAVEQYGIPSLLLMENAALGLAELVESLADGGGVLAICGRGNNGGDGLAAARHLHNRGLRVAILLAAGGELSADAAVHLGIARAMGVRVEEAVPGEEEQRVSGMVKGLGPARVIVDALLGTGLDRPVAGHLGAMIAAVNRARDRQGCTTVAADVPSGLDADNGRGLAESADERDRAVRADFTVTFVGHKKGFVSLEAQPFLGEVIVREIGAPIELVERLGEEMPESNHAESPPSRPGRARAPNRPGPPG